MGPDPFGTVTKLHNTDKPCVYTGPGGPSMIRICSLVPNGSTYEGDPKWNRTVPVSNRSRVNRVDPIPNEYEHIRTGVNVACKLHAAFKQSTTPSFASSDPLWRSPEIKTFLSDFSPILCSDQGTGGSNLLYCFSNTELFYTCRLVTMTTTNHDS